MGVPPRLSNYYGFSKHLLKFHIKVLLQFSCTIFLLFSYVSLIAWHLVWNLYPFLSSVVTYSNFRFSYFISVSCSLTSSYQIVIMYWDSGHCENTSLITPVKQFYIIIILKWYFSFLYFCFCNFTRKFLARRKNSDTEICRLCQKVLSQWNWCVVVVTIHCHPHLKQRHQHPYHY